jgi:hypothetical protein
MFILFNFIRFDLCHVRYIEAAIDEDRWTYLLSNCFILFLEYFMNN